MTMKKESIIAASLLVLGLSACHNEPAFKVEGTVSGAADKTLYIEHSGLEQVEAIDSVKLSERGAFDFSVASPQSPEFYRLRIDNKVINFSIDSVETINIQTEYKDFSTAYAIKGSETNLKIKELVLLQADLQAQVNKLSKSSLPSGLLQDSLLNLIKAYKKNVTRNYIYKEPQKMYSYFALFQQLNGLMLFDPLNNKEDVKCFAAVATCLNNLYPHAERSRNLYNMVIKGMKNTRVPQRKEVAIDENIVKEVSIIDIPLKDLHGKEHHLTDLKGKVVLIDFTVYAAAPSGARNLALRELYNKYSSKGLEIYQISLDPDEHFWKTAADNLPWICVRDPKAQYSTYATVYGVTQLPTSFLVNKNNTLSLRIDEKTDIETEIKKLL